LHNRLNLAAILTAWAGWFREKEIDGALFVAVVALKKSVSIKDGLQAIFCRAMFEEFLPDSFRHQHD
jgi:hypothetical protein